MEDIIFLNEEQVFGDSKLEPIKKLGPSAKLTDFAQLLGCKDGDYWVLGNDGIEAVVIERYNPSVPLHDNYYRYERTLGARPAIKLKDIPAECKRNPITGILEVEYGTYPQTAVSKEMQHELNREQTNGNLKFSYLYTVDGSPSTSRTDEFGRRLVREYEYKGKKYACVMPNVPLSTIVSNGEKYTNFNDVWVKVEPVKWLIDEKQKIMYTEKLIFAGVQFDRYDNSSNVPFEKTVIKKFMDTIFVKNLLGPKTIEQAEIILHETKPNIITRNKEQVSIIKNENQYDKENESNIINNTRKQVIPIRKRPSSYLTYKDVNESDIIKGALESNVAIFLHGKPGCGKSDRVKQFDPDFIELNLTHLDPELLDGLAGEKDGKAVHIKPPWLEELEEKCENAPNEIHILFLEELTNASPMMQAKAYGIALDKKVAGRWKLPENARVIAAGNELVDSLVANEMAEPLYDRFAHVNIETTVENWLKWAVTPDTDYKRLEYVKYEEPQPKIHPAIYGYISLKGDEVLRTPYDREKPQPHADPRRWKMASDMLYATNNPNTLKAIIGENLTRDFQNFCLMKKISINDVLKGKDLEEDIAQMNLGEKLATIYGLLSVDNENMPKVREFVKKLGPEICAKFEVQWANGNEERLEQLQELRLKEEEEKRNQRSHKEEEAQGTAYSGISSYRSIFGKYKEYLIQEKENTNTSIEK